MELDLKIVKQVQQEMISARGFTIPDYDTLDTLNQEYRNKKSGESAYIHYCQEETLSETLDFFVKRMKKMTTGILIGTQHDIKTIKTKTYSKYFKLLSLKDIQLFTTDELLFNITTHILSPQYEAIDKELVVPTLANVNQLPKLLKNDPIVKYYNWPAGTIVKVTMDLFLDTMVDYHVTYCFVDKHLK